MNNLQMMATAVTRYGTHSLIEQSCPSCGTFPLRGFYAVRGVPVQGIPLLATREEALNFPRGDIHLAYCWKCGFVTNVSYNATSGLYPSVCEDPQVYSETFAAFRRKVAHYLVDNYDLHGKKIVEIGCQNGDFLALLCEYGDNEGIGFDPEFDPTQAPVLQRGKAEFVKENYSEKYANIKADFYVCSSTLEHIQPVNKFITTIRKAIGDREEVSVFFQVPEVFRIMRELAFWDIYYAHCSYFSAGSLGRLFRTCGFDVQDLWTDFDGQYLMIEARPGVSGPLVPPLPQENDLQELLPLAGYFSQAIKQKVSTWRARLGEYQRRGLQVVVWGGGSKTISFLSTLGVTDEIRYVVDANPRKQNSYLPITGQQIVSPAFMQEYRPDVVIVMNPVYTDEIRRMLIEVSLSPDLVAVNT